MAPPATSPSGDGARRFLQAGAAFALIAALYAAARLWRLTSYSLRPDEIFSLQTARLDWTGLIGAAVRDVVHPPLFYLLLKGWIGLGGESEHWLRLLPVLFALATPVPLLLLARRLGLAWNAINLALLLMAANAYLIYFAQELRMYSLVPLLTLCSLWLLFRFKDSAPDAREPLISLFVVNVLLVYSHYFGWLVVAGEGLVLLACRRDRLRAFVLSSIALALVFSPWAYLVARVAMARGGLESSIGSFSRPELLNDLVGYYALLAGSVHSRVVTATGIALTNVPVLVLALHLYSRGVPTDEVAGQRVAFWSLALFATMPVLVVFVLSQMLPQSIWGTRQLTFVAAPYLLLAGMSLDALRPPWLRRGIVAIVAAYVLVAGAQGLNETGRNDWRPLVQKMIAAEESRDAPVLVYAFGSMDEVIAFYASEAGDRRFVTRRIRDAGAMQGEHFWVAYWQSARRPTPLEVLEAGGYRVGTPLRDGHGAILAPVWRARPTE